MDKLWFSVLFFFFMPVLLGVISDISHRLFVTSFVDFYQKRVVDPHHRLKLIDVGNVPRWQKTIRDYISDSLGDVTKDYYVEVVVDPESEPIKGFLNGYSENDIELIRYDDLTKKDFDGVGNPDIDPTQLTSKVEIVPKDSIISVRIYRVKMEDFSLQ